MIYKIILYFVFIVIIICSTTFFLGEVSGNDVWLHLATGRWICENFKVPTEQLFSYSISGKKWIDHEWLFQVIIFSIYKVFNFNGLIFFRFFIFLGIICLAVRLMRRIGFFTPFSIFSLYFLALVLNYRDFIRPELVSFLFIAIYIYILKNYIKQKILWILVLLQIIWVNAHGFFIIGPLCVFLYLVARAVQKKVHIFNWNYAYHFDADKAKRLIILLFILIGISFFTPYGIRGAVYPFLAFRDNILLSAADFISELQPISLFSVIFTQRVLFVLTIPIFLFLFSLLVNIRELDIFDIEIFSMFLALSLLYNRNIGFFIITASLMSINNFTKADYTYSFFKQKKILHVVYIFITAALLCFSYYAVKKARIYLTSSYLYGDNCAVKRNIYGVSKKCSLEKAADFIKQNKIRGNIFNLIKDAGQLIWYLYPEYRVYVDGRTELYKGSLRICCSDDLNSSKGVTELIDNSKADCVILSLDDNISIYKDKDIASMLYKRDDWALVYFDREAMVFLKDNQYNKKIIEKFEIDLMTYDNSPKPYQIEMLRQRIGLLPQNFLKTAQFFLWLGLTDRAAREVLTALSIAPDLAEGYNILGIIYGMQKRYNLALSQFKKAIYYSSHSNSIYYYNAAFAHKFLKDFENALRYFRFYLQISPDDQDVKLKIEQLREQQRYLRD